MGRKRIHPDYEPERVLKELIVITKELYEKSYSYRRIALELDLSVSKVIKLLITLDTDRSNSKAIRLYEYDFS